MATLSERLAEIRAEVDRQTAKAFSLLTPRQVEEWKDDEQLGALWFHIDRAQGFLDASVELLREAERIAKERDL